MCTLDVPLILTLIHALAAYEREPASTVQATEASLTQTLFGPTPYAKVILAFTPSHEPAGMALYFNNYSTWRAAPGVYLEDLFVYEQFRGRGFGTALLAALAREVLRVQGKRLEWSVLKCECSFCRGGEKGGGDG
jgi:GNAT superfamily N-acetyltransferase